MVLKVYRTLLARFGEQGWWPTTPEGSPEAVYRLTNKSRSLSEKEKFEICAGAILTQNTSWTNVKKALASLHRENLMSPEKILQVRFPKLARLIRSSGYFRQKAKKLRAFCRYLVERYHGEVSELLAEPLPDLRNELLNLHGVGPETADSMLLYAGGKPVFVVDAYTRRIGRRLGFFRTEDYHEAQKFFEINLENIPAKRRAAYYNEYHALLVELGKNFCKTEPACLPCPLRRICVTGKKHVPARRT